MNLDTLISGSTPGVPLVRLPSRPGTESYLVPTYVARSVLDKNERNAPR